MTMLESKMILVLSLLATIDASYSNHPFSRFQKTDTIDYKCDKSWFLETVQTKNLLNCGLKCIDFTECRRLLFCETTSECKLYGDDTDCVVDGDATGCHCFQKKIGCMGTECTCPWGFYGDNCEHIVKDCRDANSKGMLSNRSTITRIKPESSPEAFDVLCWFKNPSAVVILDRYFNCDQEDFNRTFQDYEKGIGIVSWDRWLGLDKIWHILNSQQVFKLHINFVNSSWLRCSIYYNNFTLGNASTKYQFQTLGNYDLDGRATCGDSMTGSNNTLDLRGRSFSTYDQDETSNNCASRFGGGWWFADDPNCSDGLLTAKDYDGNFWKGNFWEPDMKRIAMKLTHT